MNLGAFGSEPEDNGPHSAKCCAPLTVTGGGVFISASMEFYTHRLGSRSADSDGKMVWEVGSYFPVITVNRIPTFYKTKVVVFLQGAGEGPTGGE